MARDNHMKTGGSVRYGKDTCGDKGTDVCGYKYFEVIL